MKKNSLSSKANDNRHYSSNLSEERGVTNTISREAVTKNSSELNQPLIIKRNNGSTFGLNSSTFGQIHKEPPSEEKRNITTRSRNTNNKKESSFLLAPGEIKVSLNKEIIELFNKDDNWISPENNIKIPSTFENTTEKSKIKEILERKIEQIKSSYFNFPDEITFISDATFTNKKGGKYTPVKVLLKDGVLIAILIKNLQKHSQDKSLNNQCFFPINSIEKLKTFYSPKLILNFNLITCKPYINKTKNKISLYVLGSKKYFKFKFSNAEEFHNFSVFLLKVMSQSRGSRVNQLSVSLKKNFEREYYISNEDFMNKAKTGDCLLFRGFGCSSNFQRFITRADYDHVALLIKKESTIYLYESTSKVGIKLRPWREFIAYHWNLLYEKITYRELFLDYPDEKKEEISQNIQNSINKFVEDTQGKKYNMSLKDILFRRKPKEYEINGEWSKSKGFFCSQLLVSAYISAGILNVNRTSGSFLPGDFSQKASLKFNPGFFLGPEEIIDFTRYF